MRTEGRGDRFLANAVLWSLKLTRVVKNSAGEDQLDRDCGPAGLDWVSVIARNDGQDGMGSRSC